MVPSSLTVSYLVTFRIETEGDVALVSSVLNEFLTYLESNRSKYFTSKNYVSAGEDYLAKLEQETE